jgi:hypothetical protein
MQNTAAMLRCLLGLACAFAIGCMPPATKVVNDEQQLLGALATGEFRGWGWIQMNETPYQSTLDTSVNVTMFVSSDAAAAYTGVAPDQPTSMGPEFPVGGTVVRQVSNAKGVVTLLTVMVKRERGYFPAVGDFFFGVADPTGAPVADKSGAQQWGPLTECATCHEGRASAGFLFGVEPSDRNH